MKNVQTKFKTPSQQKTCPQLSAVLWCLYQKLCVHSLHPSAPAGRQSMFEAHTQRVHWAVQLPQFRLAARQCWGIERGIFLWLLRTAHVNVCLAGRRKQCVNVNAWAISAQVTRGHVSQNMTNAHRVLLQSHALKSCSDVYESVTICIRRGTKRLEESDMSWIRAS